MQTFATTRLSKMSRAVFCSLLAAAVCAAGACSTIEVPRATGAPPRDAKNTFSHAEFDAVVKKFVNKTGRVDYGGLRLDHAQLDKYLGQLAQTSPVNDKSLFPNKWHKLAYWVNAYNACVLKQVIDRNITESVGDSLPNQAQFFVLNRFEIGGETMNLNAIEDKAREEGDARINFLLNFAAGTCPRLRFEACAGEKFDAIADEAAVEFCNDERNVRIGPKNADNPNGSITLSKLFERREKDFLEYTKIRGVANPSIRDAANLWRKENRVPLNANIYYSEYDWTLNKQEFNSK